MSKIRVLSLVVVSVLALLLPSCGSDGTAVSVDGAVLTHGEFNEMVDVLTTSDRFSGVAGPNAALVQLEAPDGLSGRYLLWLWVLNALAEQELDRRGVPVTPEDTANSKQYYLDLQTPWSDDVVLDRFVELTGALDVLAEALAEEGLDPIAYVVGLAGEADIRVDGRYGEWDGTQIVAQAT